MAKKTAAPAAAETPAERTVEATPVPPPPPAPEPEPEPTDYKVDRSQTIKAARIREVIKEFQHFGRELETKDIQDRLAEIWDDVSWTDGTATSTISIQKNKLTGGTTTGKKKPGPKPGSKNKKKTTEATPAAAPATKTKAEPKPVGVAATVAEIQGLAKRVGWGELGDLVKMLTPADSK